MSTAGSLAPSARRSWASEPGRSPVRRVMVSMRETPSARARAMTRVSLPVGQTSVASCPARTVSRHICAAQ